MNNEVETDLSYKDYFTDQRCKDLETLLRGNSEFAEYKVKRQVWGGDWRVSPFIIQDEDGHNLIDLYPELVEALNDSEFLSYVNVELKYMECSVDPFWYAVATLVLAPAAVLHTGMTVINIAAFVTNLAAFVTVLGVVIMIDLLTFTLGTVYNRRRKRNISERQRIDLIAAQKDPTLLSALQKLATLPDLDDLGNKYHRKRLNYLEDRLGKL